MVSMNPSISKPCMEQLFFSLDPIISLTLSQNSDMSNGFSGFGRGRRYDEYSKVRESNLLKKRRFPKFLHGVQEQPMIKKQFRLEGNSVISQEDENKKKKQSRLEKLPPVKKQSLFELSPIRKAVPRLPSSLAQSVPNFSAVLRKENRRPAVNYNVTTPPASKSRYGGVLRASVSKSAIAGEKSKGMMMSRKSYSQFFQKL